MPYVDRDQQGRVVGIYSAKQHFGQEFVEGAVELFRPFEQESAMQRLRTFRAPILNALAGIGFDAVAASDQATMDAVTAARQGLKDIPQLASVLAATSDEAFDDAVMLRYRELSAAAPENVRIAFKELA